MKKVVVGAEARTKMLDGVNILSNAVKATLGPRGRNAAIERERGAPLITKDGVTVARAISLSDPLENMGAQLIKSVASSANQKAGDGTTTATVLAQEIFSQGLKMVSAGHNPILLKRGMDYAVEMVMSDLDGQRIVISDTESLFNVATISANNDSKLGRIISDAISAIGDNGTLTVEESSGETRVEYTDGLKLDRGYESAEFINNMSRLSADAENPRILLYDEEIKDVQEFFPILEMISKTNQTLLIIAKKYDQLAMRQLISLRTKSNLNVVAIKSPGFGENRRAYLEDIAFLSGAKLFTNEDGSGLSDVKPSDLGTFQKMSVFAASTILFGSPRTKDEILERIDALKFQAAQPELLPYHRDQLNQQMSRISGSSAILKVGGSSEAEVRERRDRIEDAINAVKSSLEQGVVPGGGAALLKASKCLDFIDFSKLTAEETAGVKIIQQACRAPFCQIAENAGVTPMAFRFIDKIYSETRSFSGFDALRLRYVDDMMAEGIIDPVKVVKSSLEFAASASGTLLTTEVAIFIDTEFLKSIKE